MDNWAKLYVKKIVRLNGVQVLLVSDLDPCFTSASWHGLQKALDTLLDFNTAFHPQTECLNMILEDMVLARVMDFTGS